MLNSVKGKKVSKTPKYKEVTHLQKMLSKDRTARTAFLKTEIEDSHVGLYFLVSQTQDVTLLTVKTRLLVFKS